MLFPAPPSTQGIAQFDGASFTTRPIPEGASARHPWAVLNFLSFGVLFHASRRLPVDWQKASTLCNVGALVVAVVLGATQFYIWHKHGEIGVSSSMVGFGVLLVILLFISGVVIRWMAPRDAITTLPVDESFAPSIPIAEPGTTMSISPQELLRLFKTGGTSSQANRLIQPYVGKWMQISGVVNDVSHFGPDTNQVSLTGPKGVHILVYFREKWADEVSMLVKGENITVRGQFTSIPFSDTVRLADCELLAKRRS
jgi:hypothetical protein